MKKTILWLTALCVVGVGCSEKKESPKTSAVVPKSLTFKPQAPGAKLTHEQVNELKNALGSQPMMELPPGELVFEKKDLSAAERAQKEADLAAKDENSYAMLKDIQIGCQKPMQTQRIESSLPTGADGSIDMAQIQVGDYVRVSQSSSIRGGNKCPASLESSFSAQVKAESVDRNKKILSLVGSAPFQLKGTVLDQKYAQLLQKRGVLVSGDLSGAAIVKDEQVGVFAKAQMSGSYVSLLQEIPYTFAMQILSSTEGETSGQTEVIIAAQIKMQNFNISLDAHTISKKGQDEPFLKEFYINGHRMTPEEMNSLVGEENPILGANSEMVRALRSL